MKNVPIWEAFARRLSTWRSRSISVFFISKNVSPFPEIFPWSSVFLSWGPPQHQGFLSALPSPSLGLYDSSYFPLSLLAETRKLFSLHSWTNREELPEFPAIFSCQITVDELSVQIYRNWFPFENKEFSLDETVMCLFSTWRKVLQELDI